MQQENMNNEENKALSNIEGLNLNESQMAEQLYNNAGLDPVIEAGLKDYDDSLQKEDKFITKVFGPRSNDIKGYGQAVAKRVAVAVFELLNRQYGGRMGDLRSYIAKLEDDRDRANDKYDELMGRVVGILGNEYKELRTDSNKFMDRLTQIMGDDIKATKIDQAALAERLGDIDGLRAEVSKLQAENKRLTEDYEKRLTDLEQQRQREKQDSENKIASLEKELATTQENLKQSQADYKEIKQAVNGLEKKISTEDIGKKLSDPLYDYLLEDSQVPQMVMSGVGKFIDFKKYLGDAAAKGAAASKEQAQDSLKEILK